MKARLFSGKCPKYSATIRDHFRYGDGGEDLIQLQFCGETGLSGLSVALWTGVALNADKLDYG